MSALDFTAITTILEWYKDQALDALTMAERAARLQTLLQAGRELATVERVIEGYEDERKIIENVEKPTVCPSCTWRGDVELNDGVCPQCDTNWWALMEAEK